MNRPLLLGLLLGLAATCAARAEGDAVAAHHAAWRSCLRETFARSALAGSPAAEGALRTCRAAEGAYLAALAASPLLDRDDVARTRPALVERAKGWLLGQAVPRPL